MSFKWTTFKSQWWSKKDVIKGRDKWSIAHLWDATSLGDSEQMEKDIFDRGGNFNAVKSIVHNASDQTLGIMNTNIESKNYEQDPLYAYMKNLESQSDTEKKKWPINYYHFIHWITHKIKNRTLKGEDYGLLWGRWEINQEVFKRYRNVQFRYKHIGADVSFSSIFDNHTSNRELDGFFWWGLMILSKSKWLKGSLEYLESHIAQCEKMFNEWVSSTDIWLCLINNDYQKVIDIKRELWKSEDFLYDESNNEYKIRVGVDYIIARGKTLQELIDDFVSKKWAFDQKDKIKKINIWNVTDQSTPTQKMWYVLSNYTTYKYLRGFWLWTNNAATWFNWPSAGYGLDLMDTFQQYEYENSAKILMKLMAENWNDWIIPEDKVQGTTKSNLLKCGVITIKNGIVSFTENAIKKIETRYNKQKVKALEEIRGLEELFANSSISLPTT